MLAIIRERSNNFKLITYRGAASQIAGIKLAIRSSSGCPTGHRMSIAAVVSPLYYVVDANGADGSEGVIGY